jgi:dUTP pyrophosphatase
MSNKEWNLGEHYEPYSLGFYKLYSHVQRPVWATEDSACFDLHAHFEPGKPVKIFSITNNEREVIPSMNSSTTGAENSSELILPIGARALIPTGIVFDIPEGYSVRLYPRSGLSVRKGLTMINGEGIIDSDYVEEVYVTMHNASHQTIKISHGERIAQAELIRSLSYEVVEIAQRPGQKTSRSGGLGSTGVK